MDPIVLRVSTNQNKVALGAVWDAFAEFIQITHTPSHKSLIEGPNVGNQFTIELMGTVAEAAKRAQ